jgi:hypothetical protein
LLGAKIKQLSEIRMSQLNGALVYASRRGTGILRFDSRNERKDTPADFAVRCSMSIPFFFQPLDVDGRPAYDGGVPDRDGRFRFDRDRKGFPALEPKA